MMYGKALRYLVILLCLVILNGSVSKAGCALSSEDWIHIQTGLATANFFGYFNTSGDCKVNGTGLRGKYDGCSITFETVLNNEGLSSNCRTSISNVIHTANGVLNT